MIHHRTQHLINGFKNMNASELLSDRFVAVTASSTISNAITKLLDCDAEVLLVIGQDGQLLGSVSDSILLRATVDSALSQSPVSLHMNRNLATVSGKAPLDLLLDQLVLHDLRFIPVVDQDRVAGVVMRHDLLRFAFDKSQTKNQSIYF